MGYCYDVDGKLCCDWCGVSGGVRKYRCPFGYCPSAAACPTCRQEKAHLFGRANHRLHGCEKLHQRFLADAATTAAMLLTGKAVRTAALSQDSGAVKVWFKQGDTDLIRYMKPGTYDSISLLKPASIEDYERFGTVSEKEEDVCNAATGVMSLQGA